MTNYLALIRKADFTDLFKYGRLHINNDMKTDFSCSVEELPSHPEVFHHLTHFANSFDSAFAYLIIHYVKASSNGLANDVNIEEVQNIYPLDFESKEAFAMSFDERIRIENPIWPESVWSLQKQQQFNDCLKGAANLREILGFKDSDHKCKEIISDDIVHEVVNELYDDIRPSGNLSIWVYLLRYERHSYYPQTTLGYFMDMVNVGCNRMAKKEVVEDDIKSTKIFNLLDSLRKHPKSLFEDIYKVLKEDAGAKEFFKRIDEYESRVKFSKVATLFLLLRNRYNEDFVYEQKIIDHCKKFEFEFELAAYLLGIVLGHQHTYDSMYDMLPLPIFKKTSNAQSLSGSHTNNGQESSESKDSPESKETSEPKDVPETKKETPEPKDSQVSKETSEPKDVPEIKKETPEPKDSQESKETSKPKDAPETKETPESKDASESKDTSWSKNRSECLTPSESNYTKKTSAQEDNGKEFSKESIKKETDTPPFPSSGDKELIQQ